MSSPASSRTEHTSGRRRQETRAPTVLMSTFVRLESIGLARGDASLLAVMDGGFLPQLAEGLVAMQ
jgi:hypothetical protein